MISINFNEQQLISGGYYSSFHSLIAAPYATVSQVFENSKNLEAYDTEGGYIVQVCCTRSRFTVPPKNGDYNVQGQQYSWGTWWDDTH